MIRTQISLDEAMYEDAKREARRAGISFAEFLRRALDHALEPCRIHGEKPWMRHAGSLASGDPDASENIDEVVYGRSQP